MILKASQRGGGKQLALHLLRRDQNEHVELHEIRGFASEDVTGALKEAYAVSKGTRCKQFLFSVSLNPPSTERVPVETFEDAVNRIEQKNGLTGHPRIVIFHEKEGRRHAHAVWSRIDADTMTAKNLSHFKLKLRDLSREIYIENGWKMPRGLMNSREADPRNFTLKEWQQARRMRSPQEEWLLVLEKAVRIFCALDRTRSAASPAHPALVELTAIISKDDFARRLELQAAWLGAAPECSPGQASEWLSALQRAGAHGFPAHRLYEDLRRALLKRPLRAGASTFGVDREGHSGIPG